MTDTDTQVVCRADGMVQPAAIPFVDMDLPTISDQGTEFKTMGWSLKINGGILIDKWKNLDASYQGPGDEQLFASMDPVRTNTTDVGDRFIKTGGYLQDLADSLATPIKALKNLKNDAADFVAEVEGGVSVSIWDPDHPAYEAGVFSFVVTDFADMGDKVIPWDQHTPSVDRNNQLIEDINAQVVLVDQARVECVNAIRGLQDACVIEEVALTEDDLNVDGTVLPYGTAGRGDRSCSESADDAVNDSVKNLINGVLGLVAVDGNAVIGEDNPFDGDLFVQSWSGLFQSIGAIGVTLTGAPFVAAWGNKEDVPEWYWNSGVWAKDLGVNVWEGTVGTSESWEDNPSYAASFAATNIVTMFIGGGVGAGVKGASVAGRAASVLERVGVRVTDALANVLRKVDAGVATASDVVTQLTKDLAAQFGSAASHVGSTIKTSLSDLAEAVRQQTHGHDGGDSTGPDGNGNSSGDRDGNTANGSNGSNDGSNLDGSSGSSESDGSDGSSSDANQSGNPDGSGGSDGGTNPVDDWDTRPHTPGDGYFDESAPLPDPEPFPTDLAKPPSIDPNLYDKDIISKFDVSTGKDDATFWSGRVYPDDGPPLGVQDGAAEFTTHTHGETLEQMLERQGLLDDILALPADVQKETFNKVSSDLAANASGDVRAYQGELNPNGNVWEDFELPTLVDNPKVTSITIIDAETGTVRSIFTRSVQ